MRLSGQARSSNSDLIARSLAVSGKTKGGIQSTRRYSTARTTTTMPTFIAPVRLAPGPIRYFCVSCQSVGKALGLPTISPDLMPVRFAPDRFALDRSAAASVHLLTNTTHSADMDFKPHESPLQHKMIENPWVQEDGYLTVREGSGLGMGIKEDLVEKYLF